MMKTNFVKNESLPVIAEKMLDAAIPGIQIEFSPLEAQVAGAFIEDALTEKDAIESSIDSQTSGINEGVGDE